MSVDECALYLCTAARNDMEKFLPSVITGGVDIVQLRDKRLDARDLISVGRRMRAICHDAGVPFIMNDRPDLALEIEADGVHVGQDDAPVALCRRLLGPDAIIGLSTHEDADLDGALDQDVTYLSAGPVQATPTKPGRPGTGIGYVQRAIARSHVPIFVTGGVTPTTIPELRAAGVTRFVVVRALTEASDPHGAALSLSRAIRSDAQR